MNRRDFLKMGGVISVAGLIAASPLDVVLAAGIETSAFGKRYKAASKGRVLVSQDKGKSWQLLTQFAAGYSILDIFTAADKQLYVKVGYQNLKFHLVLTEDKTAWLAKSFKTQPKPKA